MTMRKTSVYLPDDLKAALAESAGRTGRSEADLIRVAVERITRTVDPDDADGPVRRPLPDGPGLVGVGVGPGDPDLLTGRARRLLRHCDRVLAATTSVDAVGRAEAVVRSAEPDVGVERLVLHISPGEADRGASVDDAAARIAACLDRGELVGLALLGDPNLFSPFASLRRALQRIRPGARVETVPGIMAFQELAARTGTVVAEDGERATLVTLGATSGDVDDLLARGDTAVVVVKGGRGLPALAATLERTGRLDGAVVGEMLGLAGERAVPLRRVADRPGAYLATTIVPTRRDCR
jgi:precorrin-2/cobalt-factor-2 C20-methyltransferase